MMKTITMSHLAPTLNPHAAHSPTHSSKQHISLLSNLNHLPLLCYIIAVFRNELDC